MLWLCKKRGCRFVRTHNKLLPPRPLNTARAHLPPPPSGPGGCGCTENAAVACGYPQRAPPSLLSRLPPLICPPPFSQAPEVVAVRKTRLSLVRTHNELAKLELRDDHQPEAEVQFKAAIEKCKQIYGDLSPEAGEWRGWGVARRGVRVCGC